MVKQLSIVSVLFLLSNFLTAQKISEFRLEQKGQSVVIYYFLDSEKPCEVQLKTSADNGLTWSTPIYSAKGDVGLKVMPGRKIITWDVVKSGEKLVGDNIQFKVVAIPKLDFEPDMILVEGSTFDMGSNTGKPNEQPVHKVELNSFYIGTYEVTQAEWRAVMGENPKEEIVRFSARPFSTCDKCPVETVSWIEAQEFVALLNKKTGRNYRLPTEAEWEYAARGGKLRKGFFYSGSDNFNEVGWFGENSDKQTHEVGLKKANELGIFDMSGNVAEWCLDWQGPYSNDLCKNPVGPLTGEGRVHRGSFWLVNSEHCHVTKRDKSQVDFRMDFIGIRLVLPLDQKKE